MSKHKPGEMPLRERLRLGKPDSHPAISLIASPSTSFRKESNCRADLAKDLGLPLSKVRVICKYMGAGFGNKNQCQDLDLMVAVLAKVTGQPVKLEFTREDDFIGMHGRWASEQHYRIGVKKDGTVTAVELDAVTNMGAYRKQSGNLSGTDFYQIPNFKKVIKPVHTNTVLHW